MRYENPLYMVEDAGAADLIAGGRLQLGISRGSPEQVIDGFRYFGYAPAEGETDADMARQHTEVFLQALSGVGFAEPNPSPMFPNPPGLLRPEPHSPGLRDRIWWGAGSRATAEWTGQQGMNLMSSTLLTEDAGVPFHELQAEQIRLLPRGVDARPGTSASRACRSVAASSRWSTIETGPTSAAATRTTDQVGYLDAQTKAIFGRSYAAEPDVLVKELAGDTAIQAADTLLLTVPNQLGVEYNAHAIESILKFVAPELGWR